MEASTYDIATRPATRVDQPARPAGDRALPQLGLGGIIGVWGAAALPMALLAWVVAPLLADQLSGPGSLARALLIALAAGLVWQFVLVLTWSGASRGRCAG